MNNSDMHKPKQKDKELRTPVLPSTKRVWVTPAFEQVALKDSLNGTNDSLPDDLITLAS